MSGDSADGYLVAAGEHPAPPRWRSAGPAPKGFGPDSVDGGSRVDEDRIPATALLALMHDAKCLVGGEHRAMLVVLDNCISATYSYVLSLDSRGIRKQEFARLWCLEYSRPAPIDIHPQFYSYRR